MMHRVVATMTGTLRLLNVSVGPILAQEHRPKVVSDKEWCQRMFPRKNAKAARARCDAFLQSARDDAFGMFFDAPPDNPRAFVLPDTFIAMLVWGGVADIGMAGNPLKGWVEWLEDWRVVGDEDASADSTPKPTSKRSPDPKSTQPQYTTDAGNAQTATSTPKPTPRPITIPGDGQYLVGVEVEPGVYRSPGPAAGHDECYVFAYYPEGHDRTYAAAESSRGPVIVTIPSDALKVETSHCKTLVKVR